MEGETPLEGKVEGEPLLEGLEGGTPLEGKVEGGPLLEGLEEGHSREGVGFRNRTGLETGGSSGAGEKCGTGWHSQLTTPNLIVRKAPSNPGLEATALHIRPNTASNKKNVRWGQ